MMNAPSPASERPADITPGAAAGQAALPVADTLAALVAAREAKGLSGADVAGQLKLASRQVAALEQGDWAALPGPAFVRGALRAYGRCVGVAVDGLLATLDDDTTRASQLRPTPSLGTPMPSASMLGFGGGGRGSKTAWLILGAILLLALALFFGRDTDFSTIPSLLPRSLAPAPPVAGAAGAAARSTVEQIATLPQSRPGATAPASAAPVPDLPSATVSAASPGAAAGTPQPAPAERVAAVRLQFDQQSWVDIKEADGRALLSGVQMAGTEARLPLVSEMSLLIGNAEHVRVEHNGRPVDIKPLIRQGVARLTLNP